MSEMHSKSEKPSKVDNFDSNSVRELIFKDNKGMTLTIPMEINKESITGIIDTAAQITIISRKFLSKMANPPQCLEPVRLRNAQENSVMLGWETNETLLTIGSKNYHWTIVVAPIEDECIIGLDFLKAMKCNIDLDKNVLNISGKEIPIYKITK